MRRWKTRARAVRLAMWIGVLLAASGASAWAAVQTGAQDFVPVTQIGKDATDALPATPLLYAAYAFVWVALLAYVFLLWRRVGRVEKELADVAAKLSSRR